MTFSVIAARRAAIHRGVGGIAVDCGAARHNDGFGVGSAAVFNPSLRLEGLQSIAGLAASRWIAALCATMTGGGGV
ncbi:MAG: hypothetical protein P4L66_13310 [Acetobacteraceae bacterium]|nr:hypothetical protein [Acetobacteraceae bacterium]